MVRSFSNLKKKNKTRPVKNIGTYHSDKQNYLVYTINTTILYNYYLNINVVSAILSGNNEFWQL